MRVSRAEFLIVVVLAFFIVASYARCDTIQLSWSPVALDLDGNTIPGLVQYRLYYSGDGSMFTHLGTVDVTQLEHETADVGCFYLYITAYSVVSGLESAASNTVQGCTDGPDVSGGPQNAPGNAPDLPPGQAMPSPPATPVATIQINN